MKCSLDYVKIVWSLRVRKTQLKPKKIPSKNIKVILSLVSLTQNDLILTFFCLFFYESANYRRPMEKLSQKGKTKNKRQKCDGVLKERKSHLVVFGEQHIFQMYLPSLNLVLSYKGVA